MIKQIIKVKHYWKVIVYYNIDYDFFNYIADKLVSYKLPVEEMKVLRSYLQSNKAKAVTVSNLDDKISIILFNKHKDKADYISSIVHEAEHVKDAMLEYYNISNKGEPPAYTIGYLVKEMFKVYNTFLCSCSRENNVL